MEAILLTNRLLQVLKVAQNSMTKSLSEVVVQYFDDSAQMLELLDLLPARCDRNEDGPDAVTEDPVRERWCVVRVLDVKQLLHAFFRHLLDVLLVPLEELKEDADYFSLDLNNVKVKKSLQS